MFYRVSGVDFWIYLKLFYIKVYLKISLYYEIGVKKFIKYLFGKKKMEKILVFDLNVVVFFIIIGINFF